MDLTRVKMGREVFLKKMLTLFSIDGWDVLEKEKVLFFRWMGGLEVLLLVEFAGNDINMDLNDKTHGATRKGLKINYFNSIEIKKSIICVCLKF